VWVKVVGIKKNVKIKKIKEAIKNVSLKNVSLVQLIAT